MAKKRSTKKLIAKVTSLADLRLKATSDVAYMRLAVAGAENLGGRVRPCRADALPGDADYETTLGDALRVLSMNANETDEDGVVEEVNFVRDLI